MAGRRVDGEESRDEEEYRAREDVTLPSSCDVFELLCRREVDGADGRVLCRSKVGKEGGRNCGRSSGLRDRQRGGAAPTLPPTPPAYESDARCALAVGNGLRSVLGRRAPAGGRVPRRTVVEEEGD
jgi:hypothetical protein